MSACCFLALWLQAGAARAQPSAGIQVLVLGADACLTSEQLSARIAHYGARTTPQPGMRVVLELAGRDGVELRIFRDGVLLSRRRFEQLPVPCADRRDAIALSIALALENSAKRAPESTDADAAITSESATEPTPSEAAAQTQPGAPVPPPPAAEITAPPRAAQTTPPPSAAAADSGPVVLGTMPSATSHSRGPDSGSRRLLAHVGARYVTAGAPMPVWAGALGVQLGLSEHVALDVSALASLQGETSFASGHARARLLGLELLGCGSLPFGAFALQACLGAAAAACEVSGRAYPLARPDATLLWAAGLARVMVGWPEGEPISVRLVLQAHVNVSRPELQVEGVSESLHPGWLGATLGLELLLRLP